MPAISESENGSFHWPRAIRSLRYRNFRLFFFGQIISQIGTWMQIVAQGWVVYRLTDSPLMLGLVNFAALVPVLPVSLLAGVLSDRFPRRRIILITEIVLASQALIMAGLIWLDIIQVWHIILLSFVLGAAAAIEQPSRLAFVVDVVGKEDLSNAVALNSSAYNTARILGPSIAGLIIASFGEAACYLINSITYLAVILALLVMRIPAQPKPEGRMQVVTSLFDGLRYIQKNEIVRGLLFIISIASFLTIPYIAMMPVFAKDILQVGPKGLGYLLTAVGLGAIVGAFTVAYLHAGHRGRWLTVANILGPVFLVVFCFTRWFPISLILVVLVGGSNAIRLTLANSLTQLNISDEFHGRVMSIFNLLFSGMSNLGALVIGGLAEFIGASWALGISALISTAIGCIVIVSMPHIRKLV